MFGLDIPLPDFWIVYFFIFWVLVGSTTTPVVFRHKGHHPLLGVAIGALVGALSGIVFMLLLEALEPWPMCSATRWWAFSFRLSSARRSSWRC